MKASAEKPRIKVAKEDATRTAESRKNVSDREASTKTPKYKLFKNGTLRITCKGSRHMEWIGSKYSPVSEEEIPRLLRRFCCECGVEDCPTKKVVQQ
jgi:hypothetical protein